MPNSTNVAIVGVGLIGGSIGLALRKRGLAAHVTGVGRTKTTLDKALAVGAVDQVTTDLIEGVADADIVVIATPVAAIAADVCRVAAANPTARLITDAGSTKTQICRAVKAHPGGVTNFVGSHPLAGDHRTGPENSRADLFVGRKVVVTPTTADSERLVAIATDFWQSLGAKVHVMSPEDHDQALAATSHLSHIVASALANATPQDFLPLAATGWADTTRVAASDPTLWAQIFDQNSLALLPAIDRMLAELTEMRSMIAAGEWSRLQQTLLRAKQIRDALGN